MQTWRDRDIKLWRKECRELYDYLLAIGLQDRVAYGLVERELTHWSRDDLASILSKVNDFDAGLPQYTITPGSSSTAPSARQLTERQDVSRPPTDASDRLSGVVQTAWVKAPSQLVQQSAEEGRALCVNKNGSFSIREHGYYALSHVWSEGIQGDPDNRGLSRTTLHSIFDKLLVLGDVDWLWLDILAVPSGNHTLTAIQELEKIEIINSLANTYANAKAVIIFDALAMQMDSRQAIDVAIALLCGRWINRVWTFQEAKLARTIIVLTAQGAVPYEDILSGLKDLNGGISWNVRPAQTDTPSLATRKYKQIYMAFDVLDLNETNGCSIPDVAFSCRHRETGNDIDYVRALYPLLDLRWQAGLSKDRGLSGIYKRSYLQAAQVMTMFGRPRTMKWPGWAPDDLCGLNGDILYLDDPFKETNSGLVHEWFTLRIVSMRRIEAIPSAWLLELKHTDTPDSARCGMFTCDDERDATLIAMQELVKQQKAHFLTQKSLTRREACGLFVEHLDSDAWHGYCYAVLRVDAFDRSIARPRKISWTLRNENPMNTDWDGGRRRGKTVHWLSSKHPHYNSAEVESMSASLAGIDLNEVDAEGRNMLHSAAAVGNDRVVDLLIQRGLNIELEDSSGWTALQIAAANGNTTVLKALIRSGAEIDRVGTLGTALSEAIRCGRTAIAELLLENGARADGVTQGDFLWPLLLAHESVDMTSLLLKHGADPNKCQRSGLSALHWAARSGVPEVSRVLLEAGAEPSRKCNSGADNPEVVDPVRYAIEAQSAETVALLLHHGADPNAPYDAGKTPLICATQVGSPKIVKLLLDVGADPWRQATNLGTALDIAKASKQRIIEKLLTEHTLATGGT